MNEYNYNYNPQQDNQNEYNGFSADGGNSPKKPKKHTGIKAAAMVMAMAVVSAGSIGAYRYFAGESFSKSSLVEDIDKDVEKTAKETSKDIMKAQAVSIIDPVEADGKALSTEEAVKKILPSVVGIESTFEAVNFQSQMPSDFFDFGGFGFNFGEQTPSTKQYKGTGTGVIVSENGYIVTNAHVIYDSEYGAEEAQEVSVLLSNDKTYDAEIIGYDTDLDLAVLKIDETGLTAAEFGNSDNLQLGESVIAIGNPLGFELMNTVTGGMISGLDRNITIADKPMNLIQTDAAINSGNSGGPLINKYGQVIGINSSKMSSSYSTSGASIEGIGFAIPSNLTASIIDDIMKYGYVTGKPQLGISCQDVSESASKMYNMPVGVFVGSVNKGSAADKAGIKENDIIVAVNGVTVKTTSELTAQKNKYSAGDTIEITLIRNGEEKTVEATLDAKEEPKEKDSDNDKKENKKKDNDEKKKAAEEEEPAETDDDEKADEETEEKSEEAEKPEKPGKNSKADKSDLPDFLKKGDKDQTDIED